MIDTKRLPPWLFRIKVLVWDFDGTLYNEIPTAKQEIQNNVIQLISRSQKTSLAKAKQLFLKHYLRFNSSSRVLIHFGINRDYVLKGEWYGRTQLRHIKKDKKIKAMFEKLKSFRHILSTNATLVNTKKKLGKLGLSPKVFEKFFCHADLSGVLKPDPRAFGEILKYLQLPPEQVLYIGDREQTDLEPAKKMGMHTCLVWGESKAADICLPKVYDIVRMVSQKR